MSEPTTHEFEHDGTAAEAGALLRSLGSDLERGEPLRFETDDGVVVVTPSDGVEVEVEIERAGDEVELEIELEWADDGTTVTGEDPDADDDTAGDGTDPDPDAESSLADLEDAPSKATFELFQDRAEEWRWRLRHDNGNIVADSGEGYDTVSGARNGLRSVRENAPGAPVERQD